MDFKNAIKSSMKPMIEDIAALCRINSVEGEEKPGMPFGEGVAEALDAALEKRELIKVAVLKNCIDDPKEIAQVIGERTHSHVVKVIGKKMIFYRQAKKNSKIKLPE